MSGFSTYTENANLNWLKGTAFPAAPAGVYVGLWNGDPTDAGTGGTEVTTTVRTAGRLPVTFGAISAKTISNTAAIDFGNAAAGATISHFALYDAASGGNELFSGALTGGAQTIGAGTDVQFAVGALSVSVD